MEQLDIFKNFPILETSRLLLRAIEPGDAGKIFEMRSNFRINQFITREDMDSLTQAILLVEKTIGSYKNKQAIGWAGITKEENKFIGTCGFNTIDFDNKRAELGGELALEFWGKRMGSEAVIAILDFGFNVMKLHSIEARISPDNRSAIYLAESLGFEKEAHFSDRIFYDGKYHDLAVYSLINNRD